MWSESSEVSSIQREALCLRFASFVMCVYLQECTSLAKSQRQSVPPWWKNIINWSRTGITQKQNIASFPKWIHTAQRCPKFQDRRKRIPGPEDSNPQMNVPGSTILSPAVQKRNTNYPCICLHCKRYWRKSFAKQKFSQHKARIFPALGWKSW